VTSSAFLLGWGGAVGAASLRSRGEFARECRLLVGLYKMLRLCRIGYDLF
jgi:hypothetical protein